ncbi:DUF84 family protein [Candidatus Pacearchaeota archaeon]|nr:DUF84 family protein [Candidatus Pacearchaeota archaeon]
MAESKIIINVGSRNPTKIEAVREVLQQYPFLNPFDLNSFEVSSGVSEQPMSREEMEIGAANRAIKSFNKCSYSIGFESGLAESFYTKRLIDSCACMIYDGKDFYEGYSEGFVIPPSLAKLINEENLDLSQVAKKAGLTNSEKIGNEKGIINILTNGRYVRGDQIKSALKMALIQLEHSEFYR